jgi:hypothetical protein
MTVLKVHRLRPQWLRAGTAGEANQEWTKLDRSFSSTVYFSILHVVFFQEYSSVGLFFNISRKIWNLLKFRNQI